MIYIFNVRLTCLKKFKGYFPVILISTIIFLFCVLQKSTEKLRTLQAGLKKDFG